MESIRELYKIGHGPSSSHTMGPALAAEEFLKDYPDCDRYKVILYGSLAATGKGHLTDKVILDCLGKDKTEIIFNPDIVYNYHPNGLMFKGYKNNIKIGERLVFSVGGGSLKALNEPRDEFTCEVYPHKSMNEIIAYCKKAKISLVEYVRKYDKGIDEYIENIYKAMIHAVNEGIYIEGVLPGGLNVERKAAHFYREFLESKSLEKLVYAASLSVAEVNASGGIIVTAPTCGASAVVPACIFAEEVYNKTSHEKVIEGLLVAGLIGNLVKTNGSISGAEVGCQGEVGVACAMAASMLAYIEGADIDEIEYAAEIALEHHLGMTCDPVDGLVQIPCIERNAMAAMQAYSSAHYAMLAGGNHHVSLDSVIEVMDQTGKDLHEKYRETSRGGLAVKKIRGK